MPPPLDYQLNKLFHDLHTNAALAADYRRDRQAVIARYPLAPDVIAALEGDDVAALAPLTNGFLLRYYFLVAGMPEQTFLAQLHAMKPGHGETAHG